MRPHNARKSKNLKGSTYPTRSAVLLKPNTLGAALRLRRILLPDTVDDVVPVQTGKVDVAAFPAPGALRAVGCDGVAVFGQFGRRRGGGGVPEEAHGCVLVGV
jgi:hypothetical protein